MTNKQKVFTPSNVSTTLHEQLKINASNAWKNNDGGVYMSPKMVKESRKDLEKDVQKWLAEQDRIAIQEFQALNPRVWKSLTLFTIIWYTVYSLVNLKRLKQPNTRDIVCKLISDGSLCSIKPAVAGFMFTCSTLFKVLGRSSYV